MVVVDDEEDWVAFDNTESFQAAVTSSTKNSDRSRYRHKKRDGSRRKPPRSPESPDTRASWMEKPITSDSSWLPVAPPQHQESPREGRDDRDSRRSGRNQDSRPPRVHGTRSSSTTSTVNMSHTLSSSSSNSRDRYSRAERTPSRGRSETRRDPAASDTASDSAHRTRGRSPAVDPKSGRCRSQKSWTRLASESPTRRGRSSSRTRDKTCTRVRVTSPSPTRSGVRTRVDSSPSPSRRSCTRPPTSSVPESPIRRGRTSSRIRDKSCTRKRVTSPSPTRSGVRTRVDPSPSPSSRSCTRPPMTSRGRSSTRSRPVTRSRSLSRSRMVATSQSPRQRTSLRSSRSVGGGFPPRHSHSLGEGRQDAMSTQSARSKSSKSSRKEGGILERFFGDKVTDEAKKGFRRRSTTLSSSSIGSLTAEQQFDSIHPRVLLSATVYKNAATNLWIATINTNQKGVATNPKTASKYLKAFSFASEREAREAAIANAPPKMMPFDESPNCFVCNGKFAVFRRASHCRNCGACVCNNCTTSWSSKMLPETYNLKSESVVTICVSCSYLTDCFRKALLKGDLEEALDVYATGNVNLRCPLPAPPGAKKGEIMYPIHCAVQGGNLDIVRWLMDEHFCPIRLVRKTSNGKGRMGKNGDDGVALLTSKGRSVLNIALNGLKVDIVRYLVVDKGVSVYETKDLQLSLRALEAVLLAFPRDRVERRFDNAEIPVPRWDDGHFSDGDESFICSSLGDDQTDLPIEIVASFGGEEGAADMCIICYDNPIDCVITPCGHQICCLQCSNSLKNCPVCNVECAFIRIFKP